MDVKQWVQHAKTNGNSDAHHHSKETEEDEPAADPEKPEPAPSCSSSSGGRTPWPVLCLGPDDVGEEEPVQVILEKFPSRLFNGRKRSFCAAWYKKREWLEYSEKLDAAFCFPCRKFSLGSNANSGRAFTHTGYTQWRLAMDSNKGLARHAASKEHLKCMTKWEERKSRLEKEEISTLVSSGPLGRRLYLSAIVDVVEFLATNELPMWGTLDAIDTRGEGNSELFLLMLDYAMRKDKELANAFSSIPRKGTYTSDDIHNEIIELMSNIVTEEIVKEIGESWYTLKVDGTKDPAGCENISIIIRYIDENNNVQERLLTMATSKERDALSLTNLVISELTNVGLSPEKILSQSYDGTSVMSGKRGGMQKLLQDKLNREVPYVHCFNHQLHLVVVHAMSSEEAVHDFFNVCNSLYEFIRKPTVSLQYTGEKLMQLLDQKWTGHFATVSVILKSLDSISDLLIEIESTRTYCTNVRLEATGLLKAVTETSFKFMAHMVHKVLALLDPPNKLLQAKETDLYTGVKLVHSAVDCVAEMRCDSEFEALWDKCKDSGDVEGITETPSKRKRTVSRSLQQYVVESIVGQNEETDKRECGRLFFGTLDALLGEMATRFSEGNSQLVKALCATDPTSPNYLDFKMLKPLLDLTKTQLVESEFIVARQFLKTEMGGAGDGRTWTPQNVLQTFSRPLKSMPTVLTALKHALTFGASTALCENSSSMLANVFTQHRRSMLHKRKTQLIQLAFQEDLTSKFRGEWNEKLLTRFNTARGD